MARGSAHASGFTALVASQSHTTTVNGATSGFEMCFAPSTFCAGSQRSQPKHVFCAGSQRSQPKHVSNPDGVMKKLNHIWFMIAFMSGAGQRGACRNYKWPNAEGACAVGGNCGPEGDTTNNINMKNITFRRLKGSVGRPLAHFYIFTICSAPSSVGNLY